MLRTEIRFVMQRKSFYFYATLQNVYYRIIPRTYVFYTANDMRGICQKPHKGCYKHSTHTKYTPVNKNSKGKPFKNSLLPFRISTKRNDAFSNLIIHLQTLNLYYNSSNLYFTIPEYTRLVIFGDIIFGL